MAGVPRWCSGKGITTAGFPDGAVVKDHRPVQLTQELGFNPWVGSPLEEEVAPRSSVLAWRIPWTEEPGGLQSVSCKSWTRLSTHTDAHTDTITATISFKLNHMELPTCNLFLT